MILYIDTTDYNHATFAIGNGRLRKKTYKIDPRKSYKTLEKLAEFLRPIRNPESAINKIIVNKGPGSFTGVRVGVTHAMALSYAWNVPVKALSKDKFNLPSA